MLGSSVPGAYPKGRRGVCTLESSADERRHGLAGDRTVTLAMSIKSTLPPGNRVGGVSGRAGAKAGGITPSARHHSFACRDGERHPGFPDGGALRGATSERRSRSVRNGHSGSSAVNERAGDSGCPEDAEEGNDVGQRASSVGTGRRRERSLHVPRDASLLGPSTRARQSSLCSTAQAAEVRRSSGHRGWANPRKWEEPAPGSSRTDVARARRAPPLPQGRGRGARDKEEGHGLRPCEDQGPRFGCPHVD